MVAQLESLPWLDRPDALAQVAARVARGELDAEEARILKSFWRDGFVDLGPVLAPSDADAVRADIEAFMAANRHRPFEEYKVQLQNMYERSEATRKAALNPKLLRWVDLVLGTRALPFQTLSIPYGSEILPHVDQILMSTRPTGYMVAAWCALEDIREDAGPVVLWKGSHRLPYVTPADIGVAPGTPRDQACVLHEQRYYKVIQERLERSGLEHHAYVPRKGDVLLWHSNVVHCGAPRVDKVVSRYSLVIHYFGEGAEHFSDLNSEPCVVPKLR